MKTPSSQNPAARTRRAFLTMGVSAAAAYGGWSWMRSRTPEGGVEWPLRGVLRSRHGISWVGRSPVSFYDILVLFRLGV